VGAAGSDWRQRATAGGGEGSSAAPTIEERRLRKLFVQLDLVTDRHSAVSAAVLGVGGAGEEWGGCDGAHCPCCVALCAGDGKGAGRHACVHAARISLAAIMHVCVPVRLPACVRACVRAWQDGSG
jgi:hypothetical protein